MKTCPTCHRTFTEEHLSYCTNDGTPLVEEPSDGSSAFDPKATVLSTPPATNYAEPPPPATQAYRADEMRGNWPPQPYGWKEPSAPLEPPPAQQQSWSAPQPPAQSWTPPAPSWNPPPPPRPLGMPKSQQTNPLAIASMALGIFSITLGFLCFGFMTAPIAIVLGVVALIQSKNNPLMSGKPMAIAGIVTGAGSLLLMMLFVIMSIIVN